MNKDTSLEDIDILKLLIYILVFIVICLIMIFGFIVPNIKEYRSIQAQNRSQIASVSKIEQIYNSKNNVLDEIKQKDRTVLKAFDTKFNKIKFSAFATNYFSDVKLHEMPNENPDEPFLRYELNVTSMVKTPSKFYNFIDALQKYDNIVKIDFPIKMRGEGDKIHTTFNIKIYGLR